jgi:stress responsive alpha/beta barrel protein
LIVHVVFFEPRADLSEDERQRVLADLQHAAANIPSIRALRIGRRIRHGLPGYEQAMQVDYQYVALFEFDDHAALMAYLQHPAHEAAGRHFTASAAHSLAYDFEITETPTSIRTL